MYPIFALVFTYVVITLDWLGLAVSLIYGPFNTHREYQWAVAKISVDSLILFVILFYFIDPVDFFAVLGSLAKSVYYVFSWI